MAKFLEGNISNSKKTPSSSSPHLLHNSTAKKNSQSGLGNNVIIIISNCMKRLKNQ